MTISLMYTRMRVNTPTRVGVSTHHPLRSTLPVLRVRLSAGFVSIWSSR
jgi:hypothetical protein